MSEIFDPEKIQKNFGKSLAEAQLATVYDKFIVVGFDVNKGTDVITNCTDEQVVLLLELFGKEYEFRKPSAEL